MGELALECRLQYDARPAGESSSNGLLLSVHAPAAPLRRPAVPVQVLVLLDVGGSMEGPPLDAARTGLASLSEGLRATGGHLCLMAVDRRLRPLLTLQPAPPAGMVDALLARLGAGEGLDLGSALREAGRILDAARPPGIRRVVVLTNAAALPALPLPDPGVPVVAVGLGPAFDAQALAGLAERTAAPLLAVPDIRSLPARLTRLGERLGGTALADVQLSVRALRGNRIGEDITVERRLGDLRVGESCETWLAIEHDRRPAGEFVIAEVSVSALLRATGARGESRATPTVRFADGLEEDPPDTRAHLASLRHAACGWLREVSRDAASAEGAAGRLGLAAELLDRANAPRASALVRSLAHDLQAGGAPPTNQLLRSIVLDLAVGVDVAE